MADFEFKIDVKDNLRRALGQVLPQAVEESVAAVAREVRNQILVNATGRVLKVRSGALRRSWSGMPSVHRAGEKTTATVGSQANPYAAIHEYGGTVTPKQARFLTIPLEAMRTGAGATRATARQVIANPEAFGFSGTFTAKRIIFGKMRGGRRGESRAVPLFLLRDSVEIPARHYLTLAVAQAEKRAQGIVNAAIAKVIRERATGGGA